MKLIVCVDDNNGMMFNHRRLSQDSILKKRILQLSAQSRLWLNRYSAKQFECLDAPQIFIAEDMLTKAAVDDYCFIEDIDVAPYEHLIKEIILYKWNRKYPADLYFTIPLDKGGWKLSRAVDFAGFSHETITEEVYTK